MLISFYINVKHILNKSHLRYTIINKDQKEIYNNIKTDNEKTIYIKIEQKSGWRPQVQTKMAKLRPTWSQETEIMPR